MKKLIFLFLALTLIPVHAAAQGTASKVRSAGSLPSTCVAGTARVAADIISVGGVLYLCAATDTWVASGGGGGGAVSSLTGTPNQISVNTPTGAITISIPTNPTLPGLVKASTAFLTPTANPADFGFIRLAATDGIDWRNRANSGNVAIGISAASGNMVDNALLHSEGFYGAFYGSTSTLQATTGLLRGANNVALIAGRNATNGANMTLTPDSSNLWTFSHGARAPGMPYYAGTFAGTKCLETSGTAGLIVEAAAACGTGSGGTPGGSTTQLQFNNAGAFGGDSRFTWDNTNKRAWIGPTAGFGSTDAYTLTLTSENINTDDFSGPLQVISKENGTAGGSAIAGNFTAIWSGGNVAAGAYTIESFAQATNGVGTTVAQISSYYGEANNIGLGTVSLVAAYASQASTQLGATTTVASGFYAAPNNNSSSTVHNSYGFHAAAQIEGDIRNAGFYAEDQGGPVNNPTKFGFYGAGGMNLLKGTLYIGDPQSSFASYPTYDDCDFPTGYYCAVMISKVFPTGVPGTGLLFHTQTSDGTSGSSSGGMGGLAEFIGNSNDGGGSGGTAIVNLTTGAQSVGAFQGIYGGVELQGSATITGSGTNGPTIAGTRSQVNISSMLFSGSVDIAVNYAAVPGSLTGVYAQRYGYWVGDLGGGAGPTTRAAGMYIAAQTAGANNYAIWNGGGKVHLDDLTASRCLELSATKDIVSSAGLCGGSAAISDAVYGPLWNGDTTNAPSKNTVYDQIEAIIAGATPARFTAGGGAIVDGDIALGAGWGSTATKSAITGHDQAFNFTITAGGTGIAANPTFTMTFRDGTWTLSPIFVCWQTGGNDVLSDVTFTSGVTTATTIPGIWNGTPTTAKTYIISCVGVGR